MYEIISVFRDYEFSLIFVVRFLTNQTEGKLKKLKLDTMIWKITWITDVFYINGRIGFLGMGQIGSISIWRVEPESWQSRGNKWDGKVIGLVGVESSNTASHQ